MGGGLFLLFANNVYRVYYDDSLLRNSKLHFLMFKFSLDFFDHFVFEIVFGRSLSNVFGKHSTTWSTLNKQHIDLQNTFIKLFRSLWFIKLFRSLWFVKLFRSMCFLNCSEDNSSINKSPKELITRLRLRIL